MLQTVPLIGGCLATCCTDWKSTRDDDEEEEEPEFLQSMSIGLKNRLQLCLGEFEDNLTAQHYAYLEKEFGLSRHQVAVATEWASNYVPTYAYLSSSCVLCGFDHLCQRKILQIPRGHAWLWPDLKRWCRYRP